MKRSLAVLASAALALVCASLAHADSMPEAERARRAAVVARVGERKITVGELEDRLAELPRFQQADFGATPAEIKKKFLDTVLVRDALLELAGEKPEIAASPAIASRVARSRANATIRAIRKQSPAADRIPAEQVKAYYDEHRAQYDAPERVAIWRILVATREEADAVLAAAKKELTVANFTTLARDKSIDKATNLRAGNLGFLADDGVSNESGLRVEPAIVHAAKTVKDGELVPAPVPEGSGFAIVWRRGTVPGVKRTLPEVDEQIRLILARRASDEATTKLVDDLKKAHLGPVDTELVRTTDLPSYLDVAPKPVVIPTK